jgi:predicted Zn-dependent protease
MWSRRELLAALGASGASVCLGGWLSACGAGSEKKAKTPAPEAIEDLLPLLFRRLHGRVPGAFVWSKRSQKHTVSVDSGEQQFDRSTAATVILGGTGRILSLHDLNRQQLLEAADRFAGQAGLRKSIELDEAPLLSSAMEMDPATMENTDFLDPVRELYARAQKHGGSRIVHRSSYLSCEDVESRLLSATHNQRLRTVRTRSGVLFAAWTGDDVVTAVAEAAGVGGLELASLEEAALAEAANDSLAHVHARSAPSGLQDVILSPSGGGLVALHAIARPAFASIPRSTPQGPLRVSNDPTLAGAYGSYLRDDRGDEPARQEIFGTGPADLAKGCMRRDADSVLRAMPGNLIVEAGTLSLEDLIQDVKEGVFLEAPGYCSVDDAGASMALVCGRGREVRNGRFTGRLFSRLLATAPCAEFFDNTRGLSRHSSFQAVDHQTVPMSMRSGHWLSRASVGAA